MKKNTKTLALSAISLAVSLAMPVYAGVARNDISYQYYRDFAENKGAFTVGAINIPIYDKQGTYLGTVLPEGVPMPDLSASDTSRALSGLIGRQYIATVKHNTNNHLSGLNFGINSTGSVGQMSYTYADRNDHETLDYSVPRLTKMVYEVEPAVLPTNFTTNDLLNGRFIAFARAGTGNQYIGNVEDNSITQVSSAYVYRTGGIATGFSFKNGEMVQTAWQSLAKLLTESASDGQSPLISFPQKGDSGSPLYGYDSVTKQWVLVGHVSQGSRSQTNVSVVYMPTLSNFIAQTMQEDIGAILNVKAYTPLTWENSTTAGQSTIKSQLTTVTVDVANGTDLNNGKDLYITGRDTQLILNNDINQGAGGLYFETNATVSGVNESTTWLGSGIDVADGKTVTWQVQSKSSDRLVKLGKGTLVINGVGINAISSSLGLGDGTVILNQTADSKGKTRAFGTVQLASGRGTLVLADENQLASFDRIRFGDKGGIVDVNGNNFTHAAVIQHADNGARYINGNQSAPSTLTFAPNTTTAAEQTYKGNFGSLGDELTLSSAKDAQSNNGVLNLVFNTSSKYGLNFTVTGNTNIKGNVTANLSENDSITFQGAPTVYADYYNGTKAEQVIVDTDYQDRLFVANTLNVTNGTANFGRNLAVIGTNVTAQNATVNLSHTESVADDVYHSITTADFTGNIALNGSSTLNMGKVNATGTILAENSKVSLNNDSRWTLTGNSTVKTLEMVDGSVIALNNATNGSKFNTLTVGNLSGVGTFQFAISLADLLGDKIVIQDRATGNFTVVVADSGKVVSDSALNKLSSTGVTLVKAAKSADSANFTLNNGYADLGAYRYTLINGVLKQVGIAEQETVYEEPDQDFTPIDWSKLDSRYGNETIQQAIDALVASAPQATTEEILAHLSQQGLLSDELESEADSVVKTYALSNFADTLDDEGYEIDSESLNIVFPVDNTPAPVPIQPIDMHDAQSATEEGIDNTDTENGDNEEDSTPTPTVDTDQKTVMSKYSNSAVSALQVQGVALKQANTALRSHMQDEIRNTMWATHDYNKLKSKSKWLREHRQTQRMTQVGGKFAVTDNTALGWAFTENRSKGNFADNVGHKTNQRTADIFIQHQFSNPFFVAAHIGYGKGKSTLSVDGTEGVLRQTHWKLGALAGLDLKFNEVVGFTPYAGVAYYNLKHNRTDLNGADIRTRRQHFTEFSAGMKLNAKLRAGENWTIVPFVGAEWVSDPHKQTVYVNGKPFNYRFGQQMNMEGGVGFDYKQLSLTLKAGISTGSEVKSNHKLQGNISFRW